MSLFQKVSSFLPILCLLCFISCKKENSALHQTSNSIPTRIISFAPSITETLFALELGDHVVGVTRYCGYPTQVKTIPQIGGYIDPNYEQILRLRPNCVILLKEHTTLIDFLKKNSIPVLSINNEGIDNILESFRIIGSHCGVPEKGDSLFQLMSKELNQIQSEGKRPKILFCVGRDNPGSGSISKIYIAGKKTFYNELIIRAGGENAYPDSAVSYPTLSIEGIIKINPDIIIDIMPSVTTVSQDKIIQDWLNLEMVSAVKRKQVYGLTGDYLSIPGPRINLIFKEIHKTIKAFSQTIQ